MKIIFLVLVLVNNNNTGSKFWLKWIIHYNPSLLLFSIKIMSI